MKMKRNKLLALLLTLVMALGLLPVTALAAEVSASAADVTIEGTKDMSITFKNVVITLTGDTFVTTLSGNWITNLPAGLSQSVARTSDTVATITVSGTPTEITSAPALRPLEITIPAEYLTTNAANLTIPSREDVRVYIKTPKNTVKITAPYNTTTTAPTDHLEQVLDVGAAMTPVIFTANDGYYFPEDYSFSTNGIKAERVSYTQIKVSGIPGGINVVTSVGLNASSTSPHEKQKELAVPVTFTATGADSGKLTNVENGMKYSIDGGTSWADISGTGSVIISSGVTAANGIKVYLPTTNPNTKLDSDIQTITVTKAATPAAVGVNCTNASNNDGKLQNVTALMEYSSDGTSWTNGTGSDITSLTNGTYYVRVKASGTVLASDNQTVTVAAYAALTGTVTLRIEPDDDPIPRYGDTITATYTSGNNSGTLSYQWYSASDPVGTNSNTYTVAASDIGKDIKCVMSSSVETGTVESAATANVGKALLGIDMENKSVYVGDPMPTWTYHLNGGTLHNGDSLPNISGDINCTATDTSTVGTYEIKFTPRDYGNYSVSCGVGWLTVSNRPSGGGGGSSTPSYGLTAPAAEHGSVSLSKTTAKSGDTITITVKPDKGYTLETLTVTDKNGKEIELTVNADGTRSFKMPTSKVEIKATFMEDNTMLNYFVDVPVDSYYYDAVLWAAKEGITGGTSATTFSPNDPCTRAQVVTFLWRAAGCPEPASAASFSDVGADSYYTKAVAWAAEQGITGGTGPDAFSPYATCTRGQIAAFLYRFVGSPTVSGETSFGDVAADAYYADAVMWAKETGVTGGNGPDTFGPGSDCTRAQIVTFLYRYFVK